MLTHIDKNGQPTMVDVSEKASTIRTAQARGTIVVPRQVLELVTDGELQSKKGPVFATAIIAGTMAVKKTSDAIPFCHPLLIDSCKIYFEFDKNDKYRIHVYCNVKVEHKTGVEMEALHGVSVAALTFYDMCKAISHDILIENICLMSKTGGKSEDGFSEKK